MNPIVHENLAEVVHELSPHAAASLSPETWQQLLAVLAQIIPIIISLLHPTPAPTPVPPPTPTH